MTKRNFLIVLMFVLVFLIAFYLGAFFKGEAYRSIEQGFQRQVTDLRVELEQAEFLNQKLRTVFQTVEVKNDVIRTKEAEIAELETQLSTTSDPNQARALRAELNRKNQELALLRQDYDKVVEEFTAVRQELAVAKQQLVEQGQVVQQMGNQSQQQRQETQKVDSLTGAIEQMAARVDAFEKGGTYEARADNYRGNDRRRRQDQLYHNAYFFFAQANSAADMARVYEKIRSPEIRAKIDNGDYGQAPVE